MNFDYQLQTIETPSLSLKYFKVPWDTEIVGRPVAEISSLSIRNRSLAMNEFSCFEIWRRNEKVFLCSCRIDQEKSEEIFFLQEANFRFIELHYAPELRDLQSRNFEAEDILVAEAPLGDREQLAEIAD